MKIDFLDDEFLVSCRFEERHLPKAAGFGWCAERRKWVTGQMSVALTFGTGVLTDRARKRLGLDGGIPVPEGLSYLPYQEEGIRWAQEHRMALIADEPGLGKGHPITTRLLTPDGYVALGALKVGSALIGANGQRTAITAIFERGILPVYRVFFDDGASIECDAEHLWRVSGLDHVGETIDTLALAARVAAGENLAVPTLRQPADLLPSHKRSPLPSYKSAGVDLATWLGDAGNRRTPVAYGHAIDYPPSSYSQGAWWQLVDFIGGVVQSIARVTDCGKLWFHIWASPEGKAFAEAVQDAVEKIGGLASVVRSSRRIHVEMHLPEHPLVWRPCLGITSPAATVPARWRKFVPGVPRRRVTRVAPIGRDEVRCISVAAPDSLYVVEHGVVTHNTMQGLGLINATPHAESFLIVCPASLKENWLRESKKWLVDKNLSVDIADGKHFPNSNGVIINYESLCKHRSRLRQRVWDIGIADEHHFLMNPESIRTREFYGGVFKEKEQDDRGKVRTKKIRIEPIPFGRLCQLSGTPLPNKVSNLWTTVRACDPLGLGKDEEEFCKRYAGAYYDPTGFVKDGTPDPRMLEELNGLMKLRFMIRRKKADVLKDLPPKVRQVIPLPSDGLKAKVKEEKDALTNLLDLYERTIGIQKNMSEEDLVNAVLRIKPETWEKYARECSNGIDTLDLPLNRLANARQDLAVAKIPMVAEYVQNLIDQDEKVVVFAYHQAVIEGLLARFPDAPHIYGKVPQKKRIGMVDRFQQATSPIPFIGQYTAAGTGHTLTSARHWVAAECVWVPHEMLQAEDRCHRIGSEIWDTVWAHHLVVEGSLDDRMMSKMFDKMKVIEMALN